MLEDFIEANSLKARIAQGKAEGRPIFCSLFISGNESYLVVCLKGTKPSKEKIEKIAGGKIQKSSALVAEEATGYKQEFLPPVSIYGVRVLIDSRVMENDLLKCVVGDNLLLVIPSQEIKDFNEDAEVVDISE